MPTRAAIALGSNLGDCLELLQAARDGLKAVACPEESFLQSPVYRTAPVGCPDGSPDFYNAVVEFGFTGSPLDLLEIAQDIELRLHRDRSIGKNAPRTIDVDLLYLGDARCETPELQLPHPRLTSRRFVLTPLVDIRPDLELPGDLLSISDHLENLSSDEPSLTLVEKSW